MKQTKILSPEEWIRKVQGNSMYEYLEEERLSTSTLSLLMQWYADYVNRKTNKTL